MQDTNKYKVYKAITAVGKWLLFAIVSFLILFPVLWIFVSSITPPGELFKMPIDYIPDHPTLESYKFLIENVGLLEKIGNTVLIVGVTIVVWRHMDFQDSEQRGSALPSRSLLQQC